MYNLLIFTRFYWGVIMRRLQVSWWSSSMNNFWMKFWFPILLVFLFLIWISLFLIGLWKIFSALTKSYLSISSLFSWLLYLTTALCSDFIRSLFMLFWTVIWLFLHSTIDPSVWLHCSCNGNSSFVDLERFLSLGSDSIIFCKLDLAQFQHSKQTCFASLLWHWVLFWLEIWIKSSETVESEWWRRENLFWMYWRYLGSCNLT